MSQQALDSRDADLGGGDDGKEEDVFGLDQRDGIARQLRVERQHARFEHRVFIAARRDEGDLLTVKGGVVLSPKRGCASVTLHDQRKG